MEYLVLIETSGNQRYIFSTNKLRENVGASELTFRIGTDIVREVINSKSKKIEEIIATSGKALLLAEDEGSAKEVVREITKRALIEMPGLTVHGAIYKIENHEGSSEAENLNYSIGKVHRRLEEIRYQIPSNLQRFQRLPFAAECNSSNLPAQSIKIFYNKQGKEVERKIFSKVVTTKQNALVKTKSSQNQTEDFNKSRIVKMLKEDFQVELFEDLEKLENYFEKNVDWLAVIHADGNGLGEIFLNFDKYADMTSYETYKKNYREFSDEIDLCTKNAFGNALKKLQDNFPAGKIPVVPLILGGDDLTFICDGKYAISLTENFLKNFETETSKSEVIKRIIGSKGKRLGICAGIAIIKPHYPFHQAYHLAEQLLQSAKKSKVVSTSLSALDYHVLYDSSGVDLDDIRGKFKGFKVARPYIISDEKDMGEFANQEWVKNRKFSKLQTRVEMMLKEEDGKREIPSSQLHTLRERLHLGTGEAKAFAKTIAHRYPIFEKLEPLFFDEEGEEFTHFLDAMEIAEFWKGFENGGAENEQ